jgi:hypothetical protein
MKPKTPQRKKYEWEKSEEYRDFDADFIGICFVVLVSIICWYFCNKYEPNMKIILEPRHWLWSIGYFGIYFGSGLIGILGVGVGIPLAIIEALMLVDTKIKIGALIAKSDYKKGKAGKWPYVKYTILSYFIWVLIIPFMGIIYLWIGLAYLIAFMVIMAVIQSLIDGVTGRK